jgi:hypothetical protein
MQSRFGCEAICLHTNKDINRKMSRAAFEHDGFPAHLWDKYVYTYPMWMSIKLNIPLIFYGENTSLEYGGPQKEDTPYAFQQINNDAVREYDWSLWKKAGIEPYDIPFAKYPDDRLISESGLNPRFFSYYFNWSGHEHVKVAKQHGWKSLNDTCEWNRLGWIDDYNQIDDFGYLVDPWMKYPKYGHRQVTDVCSRLIRDGVMSRDKAVELVIEHDSRLDPIALEHYLKFSGYSERQFWDIVDGFYNRNLFVRRDGKWILKEPVSNLN